MYQVFISRHFKKQLKPYAKKYDGLLLEVLEQLRSFHKDGATHIGKRLYKIRIAGRHQGKRSFMRLILYIYEERNMMMPITIYSKNRFTTLSKQKLIFHFDKVMEELS